jgi:hypothetical protein
MRNTYNLFSGLNVNSNQAIKLGGSSQSDISLDTLRRGKGASATDGEKRKKGSLHGLLFENWKTNASTA